VLISSPGSIDTPIHVSHALEITVYFSVFGIDAQGKLQPRGGPGGLRAMRIQRPVVLPTVSRRRHAQKQGVLFPAVRAGPVNTYPSRLYVLCPFAIGDGDGDGELRVFAPLTTADEHPESASLPPDPDQPWKVCACSLSLEAIEQRMKAAETHEEQAVRESIEARNAKAASEARGRAA
jgi:hypothetical protein